MTAILATQPTQCRACPWRDLSDPAITEDVMEAARAGHQFVCHVRMGGCPGPRLAGLQNGSN